MREKRDNLAYLKSIKDAIKKITSYVSKHNFEDFFFK